MKPTRPLQNRDVIVRYDPATRVISFHTVSPGSGEPMALPFHEVEWKKNSGFEGVIDVGAGICANLFSRYPDEFCTEDDWAKIASDIRIATGRDEED